MILLERQGLAAYLPRLVLGSIQRVRRTFWAIARPRTTGARGICIDRQGHVILVRHSYMRGWFLPGGAPRREESLVHALLRELREELGMRAYGAVTHLFEIEQRANFKRDRQTVFLVEDVTFEPRLSLEIEAIATFAPDDLPDGSHPSTSYRIDRWRHPGRDWSAIRIPEES